MIAYIDGKLTYKDPTYVILDVGGIGYQIKISLGTYSALPDGERCRYERREALVLVARKLAGAECKLGPGEEEDHAEQR